MGTPAAPVRMRLLIDEHVPNSVALFFEERGHEVLQVRDVLPAGTADPVIATIGNRLSAVVVSFDKDFDAIISRVPEGNKTKFRKLGRISFRCKEARGRALVERYIDHIELHFSKSLGNSDLRMIVEISEQSVRFL